MAETSGNRNTWLTVDGTDGGYILASFAEPPDLDWAPRSFPEQPGEVLSEGSVALVNSLGQSDDERVLLSTILLNRAVTEQEIQARIARGAQVARFELLAHGPITVLSNDLEEQGTLAPGTHRTVQLSCCIFMELQPNKLDPTDPIEQHHLRMWPSALERGDMYWWT